MIRADLLDDNIEIVPAKLPEIIAKIHTGESRNGKGVIFRGTPGTGKTYRMKWIAKMLNMNIVSSEKITEQFAAAEEQDRDEVILCDPVRWAHVSEHFHDLIIDDLGAEPESITTFGTKRNVMADILLRRYEQFPRWKTHFTTNLTDEQIKKRYGERIYSRLNEMCVFIELNGKDRRLN